ncbi:MAG TPA: four helix bundle protein, partial [Xanthomarina gelatinilytica]|nr:four helix bundle protein [Xanthomarina gelatinilytica]
MKNFKNLDIWQRSMTMVKSVYVLTDTFPKTEVYGLTSQIRRAMISIPSNIAEGCGKNSTPDLARFLDMALG